MNTIDDRIRASLSAEDQAFLASLDAEESLYRDVAATFQGRMRWLNTLGLVFGVLLFIAAIYCAWNFLMQSDLRDMMRWGGGAALAFIGLGLIKLWFFIDLKSNVVLREMKRLELQIARLNAGMKHGPPM
jgi:hypothetical protein